MRAIQSKLTTLDPAVSLTDRSDRTRTSTVIAGTSLQQTKTPPRRWRKSQRTWIHDFQTVIIIIKITTRRSTVMGLTVIYARTVDPGSIRIFDAGGVLQATPWITASSCVADVENRKTWKNFNPTKNKGCREDVKLGRSSGWNPIRAERSRYSIYAFESKTSVDQVSERPDLHSNTSDLHGKRTFVISSLRQIDEYAGSKVTMSMQPGGSRSYWRQKDPDLWFKP
ncbi:hypothetical protein PHMEG_00021094 [Phytophthora megakarya]|uniref:Uncharacterized protein n=1 Tax=Phytophthora megakarya TaxID=4795 RepID=A0A225VP01_9STRA|nr:hypothetical protein PHMEG_00021094 [Phytophthora megakarya]